MTGGGARVLLAEDVSANVALFRAVLERAGCRLTVAVDGEAAAATAIAALKTEPFDLVLMDIGLPGIDGIEAARRIRAAGVTAPILALTAEDEREARSRCAEAGMNGYLTKPISPAVLVKAVQSRLAATA